MSIYTSDDLHELQLIELKMLEQVVNICKKLSLKYFLMGGTLLGAVRHAGFIPWDDDIDIGMPRKDYEMFLSKAQELLPEEYFLQVHATDPEYPMNFCKIRNSQTTFIETSVKNLNMNHGVFIDIFPLDEYPKRSNSKFLFKIKNLLLCTAISKAFYIEKKKSFKDKILAVMVKRLSVSEAVKKREKLLMSTKGDKFVNYSGAWGGKEIIPKNWYGEGVEVLFEGIKVIAPQEYDLILRQMYGNYMELPPAERRVAHHNTIKFDLKKSYKEYL